MVVTGGANGVATVNQQDSDVYSYLISGGSQDHFIIIEGGGGGGGAGGNSGPGDEYSVFGLAAGSGGVVQLPDIFAAFALGVSGA